MADACARIVTVDDPVGEATAIVVRAIERVDRSSGSARFAISGGSATAAVGPVRRALAPDVWKRLRLTWVDERCVPFDHADSNRGGSHRAFVDPPGSELALFLDGEAPDGARARVEAGFLRDFGGAIDVALLGMGEDGHVASLFPGHPALSAPGLVAVVRDSPKPPAERITLTMPALRTAAAVVLLVTGEAKRQAIARLAKDDRSLPAAMLRNVTVVTDVVI